MIEQALDRLSTALLTAGCAITILMMVHVSVDVLSKWLLGHPLTGTLEVVTFIYMSACIFLPLGIVQRQRAQITVEVFTHSLPPRALAGLDAAVGLLCGVFVAVLAWQSGRYAWMQTMYQETTLVADREMPIWYARWFPAVGFACCALYFLLHSFMDVRFALTGKKKPVAGAADPEARATKGEVS